MLLSRRRPSADSDAACVLRARVLCAAARNRCNDGGTACVQMDNEGFYGNPRAEAAALAGGKDPFCPPALDCNGLPHHLRDTDWGGANDGIF